MAVEALSLLLLPTDRYVRIFTDSQAAVIALHNNIVTSKLVCNTISAINSLSSTLRHTSITWIKAHTGHPGNELADNLAKSCCFFPINPSPLLPSPAVFKKYYGTAFTNYGTKNGKPTPIAGYLKTFSTNPLVKKPA